MCLRGACRASFGVGFAKEDGQVVELLESGNDLDSGRYVFQLSGEAHANVAVHYFGPAFGVIADEIDRRAASAVLKELAQERRGFRAGRPGGDGPAHAGRWQSTLHGGCRVIV